eukprot:TRINITY_DN635_c0_g1_i1.p1 TRINITY_DN635_c0_g1~~TRINITY_DN635_c0_g1_i1.p1  ORF type:complete len:706 (+),score=230.23 TRINITY_DN635_c0_g1_i1:77-2194(+)
MSDGPSLSLSSANIPAKVIQQDDTAITDHLDGAVELAQLIVPANVEEDPTKDLALSIQRVVNTSGLSATKSVFGSKVIEPENIGIIMNNGRVEVAGRGRWYISSPRSSWESVRSLTQNPITYHTLTIVRVPKGSYGLARENGKPIILGEGVHVHNSVLFQYEQLQPANVREIHHGTIHILQVPIGEYAKVVENNIPKVLRSGKYVIDSSYFTVSEFVDVNKDHIQHQTLHIIRVPKGKVGLISNNNKPILLAEGTYTFNSQVFAFAGLRDINEAVFVHGTITRFRVRNGEIGLAWDNNKPVFIEKPDFYEVDSPNFTFVKCVNSYEKMIILGSMKRIIVYDGEVGVSYVNGKLDILQPNTHIFDAVERVFRGFLSTKQQAIGLIEDGNKDGLLHCDTKDFVEVGIKAAVFYKIGDPATALLTVGEEDAISRLIKETSIATLQGIMRSSALNQVAQSKAQHIGEHGQPRHNAEGEDMDESRPAPVSNNSAPLFFDKVHDEFIFKLYDNFKKLYGIEISNIRIESFKIMNAELADNISKQAIITAQTETRLANLTSQREIATTEQERDAAVMRIKTAASAQVLATETQARNDATLLEAEAKASSVKISASGVAEATLIRAEAEAKSIEVKAAAEKKRGQDLSATPLGSQLALLGLQSTMVSKALQGVEKVIYLPSNTNMAQSPLQLFGMTGVNMDGEPDGADVRRKK